MDDPIDAIDELGTALDNACVELEQLLQHRGVTSWLPDTVAVTLADCQQVLERYGVRTPISQPKLNQS